MPGPMGSGGLVVDVESDLKAVATRAGLAHAARRPAVGATLVTQSKEPGRRSSTTRSTNHTSSTSSSTSHADLLKYKRLSSATILRYKMQFWTTPPSASPLDGQFKIAIHQRPGHDDASIRQPRDSTIESLWHEIERIQGMLPSRDEFDSYVSEASPNLRRDIKKEARLATAEAAAGACCMSVGALAFLERFTKHRRQQQQQ